MKKSLFLSGLFVFAAMALSAATPVFAAEMIVESPRDYHAEFRAKVAPLHEQLAAKRSELAAQYNGGTADETKVQALIKDIAVLQARIYAAGLEYESAYSAQMASDGDSGYDNYGYCGGVRGRGAWGHGGGWSHGEGWDHGGGHGYSRRHGGYGHR